MFDIKPASETTTSDKEEDNDLNQTSELQACFFKKSMMSNTIDLTQEDTDATEEQRIEKPFAGDSIRSEITNKDFIALRKNSMLTDNIINVFQRMMARDLQILDGLQDTVLGQKLMFRPMPDVPFVQVLHNGEYHWLTISTYGCQEGELNYLYSKFSGRISNHVMLRICHIMKCRMPKLEINVLPVQEQTNSVDCGVYALAFAHCILQGKDDVAKVLFDQVKMRLHLLKALLKDKCEPFPQSQSLKGKRCTAKVIEVDLFCTCHQFWTANDKRIKSR